MTILKFLGRILLGVLFEGIIGSFFNLVGDGISTLHRRITGTKKPTSPIEILEKKYLYKTIELTDNLNSELKSGQTGTILEVIDEKSALAEFYDRDGNQIEWNGESVFEISLNQFQMKKDPQ